jgi:hypothetical protein
MNTNAEQIRTDLINHLWLLGRMDADNLTADNLEDIAASCEVLLLDLKKAGVEV